MIGNDIVDLNKALVESNWQRKGFLGKIFSVEEQDLILKSTNSFKMVWLLWSMKESAYKVYLQQYEHRFFAPKKFQCKLISKTTGIVKIDGNKYFTNSIIDINYIATTATLNHENYGLIENFHFEDSTYKSQHSSCYSKLKRIVSSKLSLPFEALSIIKNNTGIPKLFFQGKAQPISFSISHHGNYGGYAILN